MSATKSSGSARPKRPLSAFNLFYRFKRTKVLDAIAVERLRKDEICRLIEVPPGLEDRPADDGDGEDGPRQEGRDALLLDHRRSSIRGELESNLLPREGRDRSHRASQGALNGVMTFVELGAVVSSAWKECDDFAKKIFHELAEEGRELYRRRVEEYNKDGGNDDKIGGSSARKPAAAAAGSSADRKADNSKGPAKKRAYSQDDEESEASEQEQTARIMLDMSSHAGSPVYSVAPAGSRKAGDAGGGNIEVSPLEDESMMQHPGQPERRLPPPPPPGESEETLRLRVRELEGQLAQQRLQARIRELEVELDYRRANEQRLRSILLGQMPPPQQGGGQGDNGAMMGLPPHMPPSHRMRELEQMMAQHRMMMQHQSEMSSMMHAQGGGGMGGSGHPFPSMMSSMPRHPTAMADSSLRCAPEDGMEGADAHGKKRQRLG